MASSNYAIKAVQLWSADDVAAWLESLSLGQLGPAFRHNGGALGRWAARRSRGRVGAHAQRAPSHVAARPPMPARPTRGPAGRAAPHHAAHPTALPQ